MSKSVLCAVDVNQPGIDFKVIQTAHKLAEMDNLTLDVISVVPDFGLGMVSTFFEDGHNDAMLEKTKELLNMEVEEAIGKDANAKVRHLVVSGKAYDQILKAADKVGCELIVIGSHKPELNDYLLGPNAARVVRHSKCSVHVVR